MSIPEKIKELMEHACSKIKAVHPHNIVDHGYLNPQTPLTFDYDLNKVKNLIRKGQLSPFYPGLTEAFNNVETHLNYQTECPICLLFYPSKLNKTRCCDKSICTECFLRFLHTPVKPNCPFCVQPVFGIVYVPPYWSKFYEEFKKKRSDLVIDSRRNWILDIHDSDVVLIDGIKLNNLDTMIIEGKKSSVGTTRRRRVQLNNNETEFTTTTVHHHDFAYDPLSDFVDEDILVMEAIRSSYPNSSNHP